MPGAVWKVVPTPGPSRVGRPATGAWRVSARYGSCAGLERRVPNAWLQKPGIRRGQAPGTNVGRRRRWAEMVKLRVPPKRV